MKIQTRLVLNVIMITAINLFNQSAIADSQRGLEIAKNIAAYDSGWGSTRAETRLQLISAEGGKSLDSIRSVV